MSCCLTAACHYLNQSWLTITEILWHSFQVIKISTTIVYSKFTRLASRPHLPGGQWVNCHKSQVTARLIGHLRGDEPPLLTAHGTDATPMVQLHRIIHSRNKTPTDITWYLYSRYSFHGMFWSWFEFNEHPFCFRSDSNNDKHYRCAVEPCAKLCNDIMARDWIIADYFSWFWIADGNHERSTTESE